MKADSKRKILIIDDEISIRKFIATALNENGFTVVMAADGKEGVVVFKHENPALVLVDLRMPGMNGLDLISGIRAIDQDVPIIVVSGVHDINDSIEAIRRGAWDYLLKPLSSHHVLLHAINKALERYHLLQQSKLHQQELETQVKSRTRELQEVVEQLKKSERRYRSVVEDQTETIMRFSSDFTINFVNDSFCRFFGRSHDYLIGKNFLVLIAAQDREAVEQKIRSLNPESPVAVDERQVVLPNGKTGWLQCTDRLILADGDCSIEYQSVGMDILDRKLGEEALRNALTEVEELKNRLEDENVYLREEIKLDHNFEEIYAESSGMKKVLRDVQIVAPNDTTVIILGESGTGKELIARALHNLSHRKNRPLVKVNCASLPANLIESELFGHERGAFTGAIAARKGRFELADGGTLFLDEIADLPLDLQTKLLRVIQEGEFERVGGEETIKVDVRVITATNRDLEKAIQEGHFRQDLYYRLNVIPINVPPLRERRDDIPGLAVYFAQKYGRNMGKKVNKISQKTLEMLQNLEWRGNIRELENVIERAVIFSKGPVLNIDHPIFLTKTETHTSNEFLPLEELERLHIKKVLMHTNGVVEGKKGAAAILDIHPNTLRSRMKKLKIVKDTKIK